MFAIGGGYEYWYHIIRPRHTDALVAQWIEHLLAEQRAACSNHAEGANEERAFRSFLISFA